jgi:hypothetical protein
MAELVIILGVQAAVLGTLYGVNYSNTSDGFGSWRTPMSFPWSSEGQEQEQTEKVWVGDEDPLDEELSSDPAPILIGAAQKKQVAMEAAKAEANRLDDYEEEMEMAYD